MPPFADLADEAFVAGPQVGGALGNLALQLAVGFFQGFTGSQACGDHLAPLVPGNQQDRQQGKRHGDQHALDGRLAAQVLQRCEQGEMPGRVIQPPCLCQVGHFVATIPQFGVGREAQLLDAVGVFFP
ncbi:hypothetical protein D3C78_1677720 [compost metagenome]